MKRIFAYRLLNLSCILLAAISSVPVSLLYLEKWNPVAAIQSATSSLVFLQNGRLVYNTYANQGKAIRSIQFLTSRSAGIRAVEWRYRS